MYLKCSRPTWLLGAAFHGPYSKTQDPIRNLKVTLQVENEFLLLLEERVKLCRVKYQACILPTFFQVPLKLEPHQCYVIAMKFEVVDKTNREEEERGYIIQHPTDASVKEQFGIFNFHQQLPLSTTVSAKYAYVQCGHMRFLYCWPASSK